MIYYSDWETFVPNLGILRKEGNHEALAEQEQNKRQSKNMVVN